MNNRRSFGLTGQLNVIFTIVTVTLSVLFVIIFNQTLNITIKNQAERDFIHFSEELSKTEKDNVVINDYYSYVVYIDADEYQDVLIYREVLKDNKIINFANDFLRTNFEDIKSKNKSESISNNYIYKFLFYKISSDGEDYIILTIADKKFEDSLREPINHVVLIGFISLIVLGNAIILLSSNILVSRIKHLRTEVINLSSSAYKKEVSIDGRDEIADLGSAIENMRKEIVKNEETKQEMLQNLSHDIKTPISVIKSYAEAIKDGVSNIEDIDVIIKQTNILTNKVTKLLEWNRLEYILEKDSYYPVDISRMIKNIVNSFKYKADIEFDLILDNSFLIGLDEYYYTMINNIVENALRYAKTIIKITLNNKKITIFNDGDPIDEKFLNNDFRPYQMGHKGQFGLGLSIVSKTAELFNLKVTVKNINNGVMFTIEPL